MFFFFFWEEGGRSVSRQLKHSHGKMFSGSHYDSCCRATATAQPWTTCGPSDQEDKKPSSRSHPRACISTSAAFCKAAWLWGGRQATNSREHPCLIPKGCFFCPPPCPAMPAAAILPCQISSSLHKHSPALPRRVSMLKTEGPTHCRRVYTLAHLILAHAGSL